MPDRIGRLIARLVSLYGDFPRPIPLHAPVFGLAEIEAAGECVRSGWVSSVGPEVTAFEQHLAARVGVRWAVATVNGTAALHVALLAFGVKPGEEVIAPALTFVATANAIAQCGAMPHFADCEEATLGIDPEKLADHLDRIASSGDQGVVNRHTGKRIAAIVPVHLFGTPVNMDALRRVAGQWGLPVLEDATEALGSLYRGRPAGCFGRASVLSFNGNKIITTGGGGAVLTDDELLARTVRHLATTGKCPHPWRYDHDVVAFNYRMPNLNAALGLAQLRHLEDFVAIKRRLYQRYRAVFADMEGVSIHCPPPECDSNMWLVALLLDKPDEEERDDFLAAAHEAEILARPAWTPLHLLPMYRACPRDDLSVTQALAARIINLPSGVEIARHVG